MSQSDVAPHWTPAPKTRRVGVPKEVVEETAALARQVTEGAAAPARGDLRPRLVMVAIRSYLEIHREYRSSSTCHALEGRI